ncbi:MAG: TolC family protein, partial [Myxococcaceae bacterium]
MALWLLIATIAAQPGAPVPELSLDQALKLARQNRPQLRQAQASTSAARARADQARAPLLPQLSATAAYQRSTANFSARPGEVPPGFGGTLLPPSWDTFDFVNLGANLNQLVFDFGQVQGRWRAARAAAEAQADTEQATR